MCLLDVSGDLLAQYAGNDGSQYGISRKALQQGRTVCRRLGFNQIAGGIFQLPLWQRIIHQMHTFGRPGADRTCRQHHLHGRQVSQQPYAAYAAAEAGEDAQPHLGKPDTGRRVGAGDPIATCQRQFQATTQAEAVYQCDAGK